jgi:hypothetical protein
MSGQHETAEIEDLALAIEPEMMQEEEGMEPADPVTWVS